MITGYAIGNISANTVVGGLIGCSYRDSTVVGYFTGQLLLGSATSYLSGGLEGLGTASNISGYWDQSASVKTTYGGGVGVTSTKNIVYSNGSYTDAGNGNVIFDASRFADNFATAAGASKTWPKLKSEVFGMIQPTVRDNDSDGVIDSIPWDIDGSLTPATAN